MINKIIYFDKETIRNILQEYNKGTKKSTTASNSTASFRTEGNVEGTAEIRFQIPLIARIKFLFSGKISANYISMVDSTVTVTSTELSDFEKVRDNFTLFDNKKLMDIENSLTYFRVAANYMRILRGAIKDVDSKEFKNVIDGYEGYDHYKIDESTYVRFNTSAFVSNYKRNDLLNSRLKLYCISVGLFSKDDFDFLKQLNRMVKMSENATAQTLADVYPGVSSDKQKRNLKDGTGEDCSSIKLFDVVYASISQKGSENEGI